MRETPQRQWELEQNDLYSTCCPQFPIFVNITATGRGSMPEDNGGGKRVEWQIAMSTSDHCKSTLSYCTPLMLPPRIEFFTL